MSVAALTDSATKKPNLTAGLWWAETVRPRLSASLNQVVDLSPKLVDAGVEIFPVLVLWTFVQHVGVEGR